MTTDDIVEMVRLFLPDSTNETRLLDRIDSNINKVIDLGFLRRLDKRAAPGRPVRYEVQRLIKAFVDGQWLSDFDARLAEYRQRVDPTSDPTADPTDDSPNAPTDDPTEAAANDPIGGDDG